MRRGQAKVRGGSAVVVLALGAAGMLPACGERAVPGGAPADCGACIDAAADRADAEDARDAAACPATLVLRPLTFTGYRHGEVSCSGADADVDLTGRELRVWLFRDGTAVLDETVECGKEVHLEGLDPGGYQVAAAVMWLPLSAPPLSAPTFAVGLDLVRDLFPPPFTECWAGCAPVDVMLPACETTVTPLELVCVADMWADDGCGF